jgi:hypothetical protein
MYDMSPCNCRGSFCGRRFSFWGCGIGNHDIWESLCLFGLDKVILDGVKQRDFGIIETPLLFIASDGGITRK